VKYDDTLVTCSEVPDELSLCINITGCPIHCPHCHSKWLWGDGGTELTNEELDKLIKKNDGITCVCFMGGDQDPKYVEQLAKHVKDKHKPLKVGWYSGANNFYEDVDYYQFNFVKIGPYIEAYGGLNNEETNQRFYEISETSPITLGGNVKGYDRTYKFWR